MVVHHERSAACNRAGFRPSVAHTTKEKLDQIAQPLPRTYESPRKSWNLIRPMVVSASKLGNTSPSKSPGMMASYLRVRRREVGKKSSWDARPVAVGRPRERTRKRAEQSGDTPAYSPITVKSVLHKLNEPQRTFSVNFITPKGVLH